MVSYSFAFFIAAVLALSQVAMAIPSIPKCKESVTFANSVKVDLLEPYFTPGKSTSNIDRQWKSDDGTRVQLRKVEGSDENVLIIKTKEPKKHHIQLGMRVNGDKEIIRRFKIKANHKCYVTTGVSRDIDGINEVSYYRRRD